MKPYTNEEILRLVSKVDKLIKEGLEQKAALKRAGIAQSSYYKWKLLTVTDSLKGVQSSVKNPETQNS